MNFALSDMKRSKLNTSVTEDNLEQYINFPTMNLVENDLKDKWQEIWKSLKRFTYTSLQKKILNKDIEQAYLIKSPRIKNPIDMFKNRKKSKNTLYKKIFKEKSDLTLSTYYANAQRKKSIDRNKLTSTLVNNIVFRSLNFNSKRMTCKGKLDHYNIKNYNSSVIKLKKTIENNTASTSSFRSISEPINCKDIKTTTFLATEEDIFYQSYIKLMLKEKYPMGIEKLANQKQVLRKFDFDEKFQATFIPKLKARATILSERNIHHIERLVINDNKKKYSENQPCKNKKTKPLAMTVNLKSKAFGSKAKITSQIRHKNRKLDSQLLKSYAHILPKLKVEKSRLITYLENRDIAQNCSHENYSKKMPAPIYTAKSGSISERNKRSSTTRFNRDIMINKVSELFNKTNQANFRKSQASPITRYNNGTILDCINLQDKKRHSEQPIQKTLTNHNEYEKLPKKRSAYFKKTIHTDLTKISMDNQYKDNYIDSKKSYFKKERFKTSVESDKKKSSEKNRIMGRLSKNKTIQAFIKKFSTDKENKNSQINVIHFGAYKRNQLDKLIDEKLKTMYVDTKASPRFMK